MTTTYPKWTPELAIDDGEIDRQHNDFLVMSIHIAELIEVGNIEQVRDAVGDLMAHMKEHFETEERIFGHTGYPQATAHSVEHLALLNECGQIAMMFDGSGDLVALRLSLHQITQAMVEHLVGTDMGYKQYILGEKVSPPPPTAL